MRILGIDYGTKRIGVAISDELGLIAQGIATITRRSRRQVIEEIERIARDRGVERIVLGYPIRLNNTEGMECERIKTFSRILSHALSLPVILQDETLSTKEAEEVLRMVNARSKRRKEVIDKLAASIILQNYLDSLRSRKEIKTAHDVEVYEDCPFPAEK